MAEQQKTLAEQFERALVTILSPVASTAGRLMELLEKRLEHQGPHARPSRPDPLDPDLFDRVRGEHLFTDLAPGMLTEELLFDGRLGQET